MMSWPAPRAQDAAPPRGYNCRMAPSQHPVRRHADPAARGRCRSCSARLRLGTMAAALGLAGLLAACGGKAVIDGAGAGQGGAGGQASGPLAITLSDVSVVIGCKPGYEPPDPIEVSFTASYDNSSAASATATISGAKVTFGDPPSTLAWSFQVSPASVGPVPGGSSVQVSHTKVDGSGSGTGSGVPCDYCGSSSPPVLEVTYVVDGQYAVTATSSATVGCAK